MSVHDYFHILGVSRNARPSEVRLASGRHARRSHPDFRDGDRASGDVAVGLSGSAAGLSRDASVDFVELTHLVDRMLVAFFSTARQTPGTHAD